MTELVVRRRGDSRLVWYWYRMGGQATNSRIVGKLLEMKAMVLGQERSAAVVAVSAEMADGRPAAAAVLEKFLKARLDKNIDLIQAKE